jgi:hypothetical protein
VSKISPVEASAQYLMHLRDAWNHAHTSEKQTARFEHQQIVLTVPASFDAEARELTVEAANQAGLKEFILLEEPLAAFYAWISTHEDVLRAQLHDGDLVLICDVGGGTTDFSLVRVRIGDDVQFERTAIGEHLLLGGDNLDLALAGTVEQKLQRKLTVRQRLALRRACCSAKERLLTDDALERVPVTVLGGGGAVVGGTLISVLHRDEVLKVLCDGFLPLTGPEELPPREHRAGLRELGLPYAEDPAITRHLAEFLRCASAAMKCSVPGSSPGMPRPDAVLFNGGFFTPQIARDRICRAIGGWFEAEGGRWSPAVLHNLHMESAVASGAAYYGKVRRGHGRRIKAGSGRIYYIGVRAEGPKQGVCVLPTGVDEGTTIPLPDRDFSVPANRPASFTLYSSTTRCDAHGALVTIDPEIHTHAPLVTVLRYGKMRDVQLSVHLTASFTEVGTLELWCESPATGHRWRLQFELRGEERQAEAVRQLPVSVASSDQSMEPALRLIQDVFRPQGTGEPGTLVAGLESALGSRKESWPVSRIREFYDALAELTDGRRKSPHHEVRWLNLGGFCLRPGFGAAGDNERIAQMRRLRALAFPEDLQCQVEWLVFWRRIAGGVNASFQHELSRECANRLGLSAKGRVRLNRQVEYEAWRLLASLEQLPAAIRTSNGHKLLARLNRDPGTYVWALGRLGARIPAYGPLSCVIPADKAEEWLSALLKSNELTPEAASAIVQLGFPTRDARRDIRPELRREAATHLDASEFHELARVLDTPAHPTGADIARALGDPLPREMHFNSTSECLLPVAGLVTEEKAG